MKNVNRQFPWLLLVFVAFVAPFLERRRSLEEMELVERLVCSFGYLIGAAGLCSLLIVWLNNGFVQNPRVDRVAKAMIVLGMIAWVATWLAGKLA